MPIPSCPKCDNKTFTMTMFTPTSSMFKLNAVCCSKCGAVVGVTDFYNIGQLIHDLAKKMGIDLTK